MTIKPVLSQKSSKHENNDIQDAQGTSLASASARPSHRLNAKTRAKSPSPQRESKSSSSRSSHMYDVTSVGGGGGGGGGGVGSGSVSSGGVTGSSNSSVGLGGIGGSGSPGALGAGNVLRRRRSPHKRIHKRDAVRCAEQRDKSCKSPPYQVDCSAITPCSSPHSSAGKSPKATAHGTAVAASNGCLASNTVEDASYSGYNSGDEHIGQKDTALPPDEWDNRDKMFIKLMSDRGFVVKEIAEDGACLFRSISLQIYGDQDMHEVIRQQTMDYIYKNREYYAQFVTEDITSYVSRKRNNHVHGNHIEIQAISEIYNRPVELYCYQAEPFNIFNSDQIKQGYEPFRLAYQRGSHYNAILNPYKASVGVGLGLPGYRPDEPDVKQMHEAVRMSEDLEIEQTMFEDKLKTTDWEATNEAIQEQIARESYMQWCRDNTQKEPQNPTSILTTASCSTVTSSAIVGNGVGGGGSVGGPSVAGIGNKSPSFSGDESEECTPYPSDEERCGAVASASGSGMNPDNPNHLYYVQKLLRPPSTQQKRRKRRRANVGIATAAAAIVPMPASCSSSMAGPSGGITSESNVRPAAASTVDTNRSSPKLAKITTRRSSNDSIVVNELPGPSKPNSPSEESKSSTSFYHALLESSYSDDFFDVGQLSEEKMLQKALQMSRMDFMKQNYKTDSDPPTP